MAKSSYGLELLGGEAQDGGTVLNFGLAIGLLIAIPLWVLIGAVLIIAFHEEPIGETTSLAFMLAAVIEAILVRYAFRGLWPEPGSRVPAAPRRAANRAREAALRAIRSATPSGEDAVANLEKLAGRRIVSIEDLLRLVAVPVAARSVGGSAFSRTAPRSTLRHTAGFAALAIAFLHYYFWDVSLQIASLHSVTVFVAVPELLKAAT